jgi:ABC-type phosphate transport system substrate-binding protein
MINSYGTLVSPNASSVAYAVLEKGGNLNNLFQAVLADGQTQNVWPLTGYTYLIIRKQYHVGSCARRQAAMQYLYDFYNSKTVNVIASQLGFATLPDFIRDLVVNHMVNNVYCQNTTTLVLQKYRASKPLLLGNQIVNEVLKAYLSVYYSVDSSVTFDLRKSDPSTQVWNTFSANPDWYGGAFTTFSSANIKQQTYTSQSILTAPLTHFAVIPIVQISKLKSSTNIILTQTILAQIFTGKITTWNDPKILKVNG